MAIENYFDLQNIFINLIVGDVLLFLIIVLGIIYIISLRERMPPVVIFIFGFIFVFIVVSSYVGLRLWWLLLILIASTIFGIGLYKAIWRF